MLKKLSILALMLVIMTACVPNEPSADSEKAEDQEETTTQETETEQEEDSNEEDQEETEEETEDEVAEDELISVDDEWNLYRNHEYGYSLKVPKKSKLSCSQEQEMVEVKVLKEDEISYPTTVYEYDYSNDCQKNDINKIPEDRGVTWRIYTRDVNDEAALEAFAQEMYGESCTIDEIDDQGSVTINTSGPEGECFINYITSFKYDAESGRAYSFDIGQDSTFYSDSGDYDMAMAESFKFLR